MRFAILQTNSLIGDVHRNFEKIRALIEENKANADLFITCEQALIGYPARDLLGQQRILQQEKTCLESLRMLTAQLGVGLLVGHCESRRGPGKPLYNSATLFDSGRALGTVRKRRLPSYDIFDDERFFEPGRSQESSTLEFRGLKVGVSICEDIWTSTLAFGVRDVRTYENTSYPRFDPTCDVLINLSASPFAQKKRDIREDLATSLASRQSAPLIYCNSVGGQDDLIFDGHSFFCNAQGQTSLRAPGFQEALLVATLKDKEWQNPSSNTKLFSDEEETLQALLLGLQDFVEKSKGQKVVLGLSGGIDSALCATLAAEALGPKNVLGISLPSQITSELSRSDARELASRLGIEFREIAIASTVESVRTGANIQPGIALENLQSRTRGLILTTLANQESRLVLSTGNKSELAMGYSTLYGDLCGAICPIGDLYKTEVYALSHFLNRRAVAAGKQAPIPEATLTRPPTAELSEGQKDSDSLPEYDILDGILRELIENQGQTIFPEEQWDKILAPKFTVEALRIKYLSQEFKRRQAPPILKIHQRSFGSGWKFPVCKGVS